MLFLLFMWWRKQNNRQVILLSSWIQEINICVEIIPNPYLRRNTIVLLFQKSILMFIIFIFYVSKHSHEKNMFEQAKNIQLSKSFYSVLYIWWVDHTAIVLYYKIRILITSRRGNYECSTSQKIMLLRKTALFAYLNKMTAV